MIALQLGILHDAVQVVQDPATASEVAISGATSLIAVRLHFGMNGTLHLSDATPKYNSSSSKVST
jgi:hypothetical protein